jgi:phospholipase D1/2
LSARLHRSRPQLTPLPDDLVTSWAQYKAFTSHAEKFNMTPTDIAGPGTDEPVKVHHDGGGTHGAGGGGSGGGVVGQEGAKGEVKESKHEDIVDGKPVDKLDVPKHFRHLSASTVGSSGGKSRASSPVPGTESAGSTVKGGSDAGGGGSKTAPDVQTQFASAHGGEDGARKATGPNEAFADWEREEMEELLGELRGHLGECGGAAEAM